MYRNMMKVLGVLIVAGMVLTACQPAPEPETIVETVIETVEVETIKEIEVEVEVPVEAEPVEKGIVEFGSFYPADNPWGRAIRSVGYRFEAENPDCQFVFSEYPGVAGGDAMMLRAQEGDPVSMGGGGVTSMGTSANIQKQWESGMFYDLADAMATPAYGQEDVTWFETFNAGAREFMTTEGGRIGTMPNQQTDLFLWINQGLYDEYGLSTPTLWSEFLENCEVLKQNNISCIGGGGFSGYIGYWYDMILYRLLGLEKMTALYLNTDPDIRWDNTPEVLVAAEMLDELIVEGYASEGFVGGDFTAQQLEFFTDRSAHLFIGTWLVAEMKDSIPAEFEFAVTYFPMIDGYEGLTPHAANFGTMNTWSIYNPGPDQTDYSVDCAIRFAKLITSAEVQQEMSSGANLEYTTPIIGGQGPSDIPGIGELLDGVEEWFPNVAGVTFVAPEARSVYWDNIVQFASGTLTAEDFAEAMARDWEDVFSRVEID